MIIDYKIILLLIFLGFALGLILYTPLATGINNFFNSISSATAPALNALNATSDSALCHNIGIGC